MNFSSSWFFFCSEGEGEEVGAPSFPVRRTPGVARLELVDAALLVSDGRVLLTDHRAQDGDLLLEAVDGLAQARLLLEHALDLREGGREVG